ncbi:MptD family putative ECF transporter S component [Streptococcus oriscaviae]|uniref:MptD family putative ECF transporter S component n=1 Tax=Streptococcus oriscaviae TaxID=2781599 RepID=A0ABX7YPL6_9STRE|nr:MptD family putative ECF transporter S component [Streptococcus oriscaviae]QUE55219.1 MptD family putative ECF transporter S component [Streptococcus oriscaviae]
MNLKVKDIMVTGAFSALYFLCVGLGTLIGVFFDKSGNMMYAPAFAALLAGPVYMLLIAKVGKFGAISLVGAVMAGFFFLSGYMTASFLPSLLFGLLGDGLARLGSYKSKVYNLASYVLFSFGNLGPILLMWFMRDAYEAALVARGKSAEYIARVLLDFNLGNVLWLSATIVTAAVISGLLGQHLVKKYFDKSGLLA